MTNQEMAEAFLRRIMERPEILDDLLERLESDDIVDFVEYGEFEEDEDD